MRKEVIGVMGGAEVDAATETLARRLGSLIAQRGWVLLNGGRDCGVMAASAVGAREAGGTVIGILPGRSKTGASPDLDYAVVTGMGDARNLVNVLSSDVVIACVGGAGTVSEVSLALKNDKPVILLGWEVGPALDRYRSALLLESVQTAEQAIDRAAEILESSHDDWCS